MKYGTDGYTSCNGVSNPITVWRQASYNPVFDDNYLYKLVNVSSRQVLDVTGNYTGETGSVVQWYQNGAANAQQFRIIQVATSQWKIVGVSSGKAVADRNGASANVMMNSYNGDVDRQLGHRRSQRPLHHSQQGDERVPALARHQCAGSAINVTTSYSGAADTDWDLVARLNRCHPPAHDGSATTQTRRAGFAVMRSSTPRVARHPPSRPRPLTAPVARAPLRAPRGTPWPGPPRRR